MLTEIRKSMADMIRPAPRERIPPHNNLQRPVGRAGPAITGGYIVSNERDSALTGTQRAHTFAEMMMNTAIVAASVRHFINLSALANWKVEPADHPRGVEYAEMAERALMYDCKTAWDTIVKRAALARFMGFSIQAWQMRQNPDGFYTYENITSRAQKTIYQWDTDPDTQEVLGVVQWPENMSETIYIPRNRFMYMVDDVIHDSPEGMGILRHVVPSARRLTQLERYEEVGFRNDLRGVPVGYAPYTDLRQAVEDGEIQQEQMDAAIANIETFIRGHIKNDNQGIILDSAVFRSQDDAGTPIASGQYDLKLLTGGQSSLTDIARSIERVNREIARILGTESMMLGSSDRGSHAMADNKTHQFAMTVNNSNMAISSEARRSLIRPLGIVNGWEEEAWPSLSFEHIASRSVQETTAALRDLATAGAPLGPNDPAAIEVKRQLGLPHEDIEDSVIGAVLDASNMRPQDGDK